MSELIFVDNVRLALAILLVLVPIGLSIAMRLGLARSLAWATLRMSVQLLLVGLVLEWVFAADNAFLVVLLGVIMATVAGIAAVGRTSYRYARIYWDAVVSVLSCAFIVTGLATAGILRIEPWYEPRYVIPLLGMVLGNSLTGISLALDRFLSDVSEQSDRIEAMLSFGATRWEAAHEVVKNALRVGMIPQINSMLVMGIVFLPGMMTGQILAGADPTTAVRYQIVIKCMTAASTTFGAFLVVWLAYRHVFDDRQRLRTDRVRRAAKA